ncbi:entry exclusion protein TrbK [Mesorhizobium sp.]|uniref:entry exclusion protein TrbK n=1 Tax=Mesorhizobium sp. TaxID=1871066 RepID=UPI0026ADB75C
MKAKLILIAIAVTLGSASLWFLISKKETARDTNFFGSAKKYPTSGGEKMKVEW